ncbi:ATP-binding cassette domain-containing protein [Salinispora arenicola]|uniref:ATP-binding cassette domain-containing protein n=1 Tax=Salinispora arenicola TaxID=168697 RepID=UPI0012BC00AD
MTIGLELASATKSYSTGFTLGPVNAKIGPGITVLVGPNGAGKSTLIGLCTTLLKPLSGDVLVNKGSTRSRAGRRNARARIGYLPQDFTLPNRATPAQFLHYVAWLRGIARTSRSECIDQALLAVGLTARREDRIGKLSGGMKRRLGIAYALVHEPDLIVLDEPTVGLDPQQRQRVRRVLRSISQTKAILVSTHLTDDVQVLADRVLVLDKGQLRFDGTLQSLLSASENDSGAQGDSPIEMALSRIWAVEK